MEAGVDAAMVIEQPMAVEEASQGDGERDDATPDRGQDDVGEGQHHRE